MKISGLNSAPPPGLVVVFMLLIVVFLQESNQLMLDKIPIGLKSYKHRRDIVFSQAVGHCNVLLL